MARGAVAVVGWLVAGVLGCGDDGAVPADAGPIVVDGAPDTGGPTVTEPAAPLPAALPILLPCPEGWSERPAWRAGAPVTCEPWPSERLRECAGAFEQIPGSVGCDRIGSVCPDDGWPAELPASGVIYVRAGETGGTGTREAPFATIDDALAVAVSGTTVALAVGEHEAAVELLDGIALRGACAERTALRAPGADFTTIHVNGVGAAVRNLRITGPGEGIRVRTGEVTIEGVLLEGVAYAGLVVHAEASATGSELVIRRMERHPALGLGIAIPILGGQATLVRSVVDGSRGFGVILDGPAARLTMTDAAIRRTQPEEAGAAGVGIATAAGAELRLSRSVVEHNRVAAISASGEGTRIYLEDVLLRDTEPEAASGQFGVGMSILDGASGEVRRTVVERTRTSGITIFSDTVSTSVTAQDLVVLDTDWDLATSDQGYSLGVLRMASFEGARVLFEAAHTVGVSLYGEAIASVEDLTLRDVRPAPVGVTRGICATVEAGAQLTLRRASIEECHEVGIHVAEGGSLTANDLSVRRLRSRPSDGTFGRGLNVQESTVVLGQARFEDTLEVGVLAFGTGTTVDASDLVVTRTRERDCASVGCPEGEAVTLGMGVVSIGGASVSLSRFAVTHSDLCGLQIGDDATMALSEGLVAHNAIGVNLQNPALDLATLSDRVVYRDNAVNLDATALPTPAPR